MPVSCPQVTSQREAGAAIMQITYDEADAITGFGHTTELVVAIVNAAHTPVTEWAA